ncbi:MAG: hypothetical protein ABF335_08565 [Alphaproteobacteria bacterium]
MGKAHSNQLNFMNFLVSHEADQKTEQLGLYVSNMMTIDSRSMGQTARLPQPQRQSRRSKNVRAFLLRGGLSLGLTGSSPRRVNALHGANQLPLRSRKNQLSQWVTDLPGRDPEHLDMAGLININPSAPPTGEDNSHGKKDADRRQPTRRNAGCGGSSQQG